MRFEAPVRAVLAFAFCPALLFPQAAAVTPSTLPPFGQATPPTSGRSGGEADLTIQSYFTGGNVQAVSGVGGAATAFRDFLPGIGMLSGNVEAYAQNSSGRIGENYVNLKGFLWKGRRWNFTAGDFRLPGTAVTFPFQNYFVPQPGVRGGYVESQQGSRTYSLFYGMENLSGGPRVSFRVRVPQDVAGASLRQMLGHLEIGARYVHLSSPQSALDEFPGFFPTGREFATVDSLNAGVYYSRSTSLKLYSDVTLSHAGLFEGAAPSPQRPLSFLEGVIFDKKRITIHANYGAQTTTYMPLPGFYAGDRRGPYADLRLRLARFLEVSGAVSHTTNNLEHNTLLADLTADNASGGASLTLPWQVSLSGQYSLLNLSTAPPSGAAESNSTAALQTSRNNEFSANLSKPFGQHSIRLSVRELKLNSSLFHEKQPVAEVEDTVNFSRFTAGAAVRLQQFNTGSLQNSLFFRGSLQARLGRLTAYAQAEFGNDLVNKTVFATSTVNTTVAGVSFSDFKGWYASAEVFRNGLISQLNPESAFALATQGVGVASLLADLNQWSAYVRVTRRFRWGAPLPEASGHFVLDQLPLIGTLEGYVRIAGPEALAGVAGIPVVLDGGKTVTTDDTGHYRFAEVPEGIHQLEVSRTELPAEFEPGEHAGGKVTIRSTKLTRSDLDLVLLDSSIHGLIEGAEKDDDLSGVVVTLTPGNRLTTCDQTGRFHFYNLPAGTFEANIDPSTLPENFVVLPPQKMSVTATKEKPQGIRFVIVKHEEELPVRKVFVAASGALQ